MHKRIGLFALGLVLGLFLVSLSSAYTDDFSHSYYEKRSIGPNGYTYVQRELSESPWGSNTRYTKVTDYDGSSFTNPAFNYWMHGPAGYSTTRYYRDYSYGDDWNRGHYGSQYSGSYYRPYYNGQYWDWSSPRCMSFRCTW